MEHLIMLVIFILTTMTFFLENLTKILVFKRIKAFGKYTRLKKKQNKHLNKENFIYVKADYIFGG